MTPKHCALCGLPRRLLWPLVRHEQDGEAPIWAHRQCLADALAAGQTLALPEDQRTTLDDTLDEARWLDYLPEHIDPVEAAAAREKPRGDGAR